MIFIPLNILIFLSYFYLFLTFSISSINSRLILSFLFCFTQIITTELILGIIGYLYQDVLILFNLLVTLVIFCLAFNRRALLKIENYALMHKWQEIISPLENRIVLFLIAFVSLWVILAGYFLPPRGADDVSYHLPVIYDYIAKHQFYSFPVDYNLGVAYPKNAELLFMWPAMILKSQRWVDSVQFVFALLGGYLTYALARLLNHPRAESFFAGGLFILTPLVLCQSAVSYIDLIVCVFYVMAFYFSILFYKEGKLFYVYVLCVILGLLFGMKYHAFILVFGIIPLMITKARSIPFKHLCFCLLIIISLAGYWYLLNYNYYHNPFYPVQLFAKNYGGIVLTSSTGNVIDNFLDIPKKIQLITADPGLGSYNGGYGILFWGIIFPFWIYRYIKSFAKIEYIQFVCLSQILFGLAILLILPYEHIHISTRYSLFVVVFGLLLLPELFIFFKENYLYLIFVRIICLFSALLSVELLAAAVLPSFRLHTVLKDQLEKRNVSEFKYLLQTEDLWHGLQPLVEPLDDLSRDSKFGWNCYISSNDPVSLMTFVYGSHSQNKIWNLSPDDQQKPDALLYYYREDGEEAKSFGPVIKLDDILSNANYQLVARSLNGYLFVRQDILREKYDRAQSVKYDHELSLK